MSASIDSATEYVVLLDDDGRPLGRAEKALVHSKDTPLHLAFSCYVFNGAGEVLMTRRADSKLTWPGVWTNTCCGHPGPGESIVDAVQRRLREELRLPVSDVRVVLPSFRYRSVMANGVVENEICPVAVARTSGDPDPIPGEVGAWEWLSWPDFLDFVMHSERPDVSPWCVLQCRELAAVDDFLAPYYRGEVDDIS